MTAEERETFATCLAWYIRTVTEHHHKEYKTSDQRVELFENSCLAKYDRSETSSSFGISL